MIILREVTRIACEEGEAFSDPLNSQFFELIKKNHSSLDKLVVAAHGGEGVIFELVGPTSEVLTISVFIKEVADLALVKFSETVESVKLNSGQDGSFVRIVCSI